MTTLQSILAKGRRVDYKKNEHFDLVQAFEGIIDSIV